MLLGGMIMGSETMYYFGWYCHYLIKLVYYKRQIKVIFVLVNHQSVPW